MLKKSYLILISVLICSCSPKADNETSPTAEKEVPSAEIATPTQEAVASTQETIPAQEIVASVKEKVPAQKIVATVQEKTPTEKEVATLVEEVAPAQEVVATAQEIESAREKAEATQQEAAATVQEATPTQEVVASVKETASSQESVIDAEAASSTVEAIVEVPESELIEMVGYLTAMSGRIPELKLDDTAIATLADGLLAGIKGEKKLDDIPQETIQDAFSQAQARAEALSTESEEVPEINENALQIIGIVILEQSGLAYLGFGPDEAPSIIKGFIAGAGASTDGPDPAVQAKMPAFQEFMQVRVEAAKAKIAAEAEAIAAERIAKGETFFEELAADEDVQKSESGLHYKVIEPGAEEKPTLEDSVLVHYKGTLIDGTQFDSSYDRNQPAKFPLNGVVPGFGEGLTKIGAGGKIILYIPSELGYGNSPRPGGAIKPGDTLIFECELIEVNPE